jgi:hypothetical protein
VEEREEGKKLGVRREEGEDHDGLKLCVPLCDFVVNIFTS